MIYRAVVEYKSYFSINEDTIQDEFKLNYGFRFGVGVSDRINISARYENSYLGSGVRQHLLKHNLN